MAFGEISVPRLSVKCSERQATRFLMALLCLDASFLVLYLVIQVWARDVPFGPLRPLLDLDGEATLASWFSSIQLFAVGLSLMAAVSDAKVRAYLSPRVFLFGAVIFIALSADEAAAIHEKAVKILDVVDLSWIPLYDTHARWILLYVVLGVPILVVGMRPLTILWTHLRRVAATALCGALIYVLGAAVLEIVTFALLHLPTDSVAYRLEVALEEFCEMAGASVMLYATLLLPDRSAPASS